MLKLQKDLAEIARIMREKPSVLGPVPVYEPTLKVGVVVHQAIRPDRQRTLLTLPRPES